MQNTPASTPASTVIATTVIDFIKANSEVPLRWVLLDEKYGR